MKYKVEFFGVFDLNGNWEFKVSFDPNFRPVHVTYDPYVGKAFCCNCSGPFSAMLSTCPHAKAVVRFINITGFTPPKVS